MARRLLDPQIVVAPVGDGPAGEVDEPERPLPAVDGVVDPVERDAGLELPEPRVGVPPGEHLEDEVELPAREVAVGVAGPDEARKSSSMSQRSTPVMETITWARTSRGHSTGRIGFDLLLGRPAGDDGGVEKIVAVGGEEEAPARAADAVAGAPDALDRRRDRGRRLR